MLFWKKRTAENQQQYIQQALKDNVNFSTDTSLGYPASKLDPKVFSTEAPFLKDAPLLQVFVNNPNNIGCHTCGTSEKAFKGTQEIEVDVLNMIAVDIFKAPPGGFDGYIAPGGTEANIQALWMYRNYFINEYNAKAQEIAIVASEDTHYSIAKGANLLMLEWLKIPVDENNRSIDENVLEGIILEARSRGKKYFITVANMGTTMFGSVDDPDTYSSIYDRHSIVYRLHIDGAYGGFVYPFSNPDSRINFNNPNISSVTIDAHKMLQAPYGTGIFICRKGLIQNTLTKEAEYVEGMDLTLCGSRPGVNAVAVWMILSTYGPHGWFEKISVLQMRTSWFCKVLQEKGIPYFREPYMNIVTINAAFVTDEIAARFDLVPQKHDPSNLWYKVVVMDHVEIEHLTALLNTLNTVTVLL
ncbi:aspartate aminotransferase family protein [Flavobacterium album]|uniref:Aspartate aminotransferase family protein n=1 Tax=Flavobacterium album TaxID=2175091 RepID=A0A2S1R067_9FLAO|nr:pyridoxal-dependent decarboxylase [Flavobacterium album]AWH86062.1 aspartate aminotransferase family protein [Flavobacterium album]